MKQTEFIIEGMSCGHCVQTATKALEELPGVERARVDLEAKTAAVEFDENQVNEDAMFEAIRKQNFTPEKKTV